MGLRLAIGIAFLATAACGGGPSPGGTVPTPPLTSHGAAVDGMRTAGWLQSVDLERGQATVAPELWKTMDETARARALAEISAYLVEQRGGSPRVLVRDGDRGHILGVWEPGRGYTPSAR